MKIAKKTLDLRSIKDFLQHDIWHIRLHALPRKKYFLIRTLRVIILTFRGFDEDKCSLRASALTFYSILSIVPAAALAFGIAKGFGLQQMLEERILETFRGQEEVATRVMEFARSMLETTRGGLIAGIGVAFLFFLIVRLLNNIEKSFNDIWGVTQARTLGRKLSDYLSIMLIGPLLLVMSGSATVFITTQITRLTEQISLLGPISPLILVLVKLVPYCVIWLLFTFAYMFMPNTKVRFRSGLLGGVIAGTIYVVVQWGYITFQIGVSRYGAIYGSFAALPLFLIWLQLSWLIVLFGAEVSFAGQNVDTYEYEPKALNVQHSFKRLLSLRIAAACIRGFCEGKPPRTAEEISRDLEIPIRLVNQILSELVEAGILLEVKGVEERTAGFHPARDVDTMSIHAVSHSLDHLGSADIPVEESESLEKIRNALAEFSQLVEKSDANLLLKDV